MLNLCPLMAAIMDGVGSASTILKVRQPNIIRVMFSLNWHPGFRAEKCLNIFIRALHRDAGGL